MKTWTIHEVTHACGMTTGELSQWISRGHFRPSAKVYNGQRRLYDWRDLACLSAMSVLRKRSLSVKAAAHAVLGLRDALAQMGEIEETSGLFFFTADLCRTNPGPSAGLVRNTELCGVLMLGFVSVIVVDIAKTYHAAATAISKRSKDDVVTL